MHLQKDGPPGVYAGFKGCATREIRSWSFDCFSHALNWGRQYFGTKRSHTWKYVSALL